MNDQREGRSDRGGPNEGGDDRSRDRQSRAADGGPDGGGRADTRFLQLEQSEVMYAEAEAVARPAFRELLLEAAKERLRERFGAQITALAQVAVDELLNGVEASLEIEARIQRQNEERSPAKERLREVFARRGGGESRAERTEKRGGGKPRRGRGRR